MTEEASPGTVEGQASSGSAEPTPATAAEGATGPASASADKGTGRTPVKADPTSTSDEPTFFDPKSVPEELKPAYKQMQGAFTKAMQKAAEGRNKAQFYDEFARDPVGNLQRIASQYGMTVTRAQAQAAINGPQPTPDDLSNWQPQSWQEVLGKAKDLAKQEILGQLQPLVQEVQATKKQSIERQLSEIDPSWQQYESEMVDLLRQHPSLSKDPAMLYRMAVPPEVIESRATQRALQKMEAKAKSSASAGGSTTVKKPGVVDTDQRFSSISEAAAWAQRKLESEGQFPPHRR